ncbi:MFS transporter [Sphingomonas sp. CL5.1]|uniref:MFS transporter n=1 Tax=Sphingomonas sp. CL5.1 TaxID=2653203 RepID=UPI001582860D|nr:MFS transporter [Sphingomonas sp. CL5.1]QKS00296.1 MFS transporter [Sphingomonas sp. CL5.1]
MTVTLARRWVTLALVLIVAALSYVDRQVFTLFMDAIKRDLALSDRALGLLTGLTFALFYALAAFPIARYADHGDRPRVIALCVVIWSIATAACGLATGFWQMALARVGLAAGEAGAGPAGQSLVTDVFPPERRVTVLSAILAASSLGLSGGLALGGWLSTMFGWREVFLLVGLPGIAVGLAVWLFAIEPRRTGGGEGAVTPLGSLAVLRAMAAVRSLRWIGLSVAAVPMTGMGYLLWSPVFFQRVHGFSVAETGFWLGGATLVGLVAGNLVAGWLGDRFGRDDPRFNGRLAGISLLLSFPFALIFALADDRYVALASFLVMKFLMTLYLGPTIALAFAQLPASMRAMTAATINMFIGIAGTGLGGFLVGALSDAFAGYGAASLRYSLAVISFGLLAGGFAGWRAGATARPLPAQATSAG